MVNYKNLFTKDLVKVIMSKFEILQSNKTSIELENLTNLNSKEYFYYKKRIFWMEIIF
jgi:hypothetical protein